MKTIQRFLQEEEKVDVSLNTSVEDAAGINNRIDKDAQKLSREKEKKTVEVQSALRTNG